MTVHPHPTPHDVTMHMNAIMLIHVYLIHNSRTIIFSYHIIHIIQTIHANASTPYFHTTNHVFHYRNDTNNTHGQFQSKISPEIAQSNTEILVPDYPKTVPIFSPRLSENSPIISTSDCLKQSLNIQPWTIQNSPHIQYSAPFFLD